MMIDIDPHEDRYRCIALIAVIIAMLIARFFELMPVEVFNTAIMLIVGYLCGRVRGKKER